MRACLAYAIIMSVFKVIVGILVSVPLLQAVNTLPDNDIETFTGDKQMLGVILKKLQEFDAMKERLNDLESKMAMQEEKMKRLEDTVSYQADMLMQQGERIRDLEDEDELRSIKPGRVGIHEHVVPSDSVEKEASPPKERRLLTEIDSDRVAFTAYLGKALTNLGDGHTLQFQHVLLNDGHAYNSNTGIFTCPVAGVYLFSFFISEYSVHDTRVQLVVDRVNQVDAIAEGMQNDSNDQGGNLAVIRLARGQAVWLQVYDHGSSSQELHGASYQRRNTFSGVLLYSD